MNKILWTPERIAELQKANKELDQAWHRGKRRRIASVMGMTYNQINSALRRFCRGKG
jgi:ribosomal protein S12